MNALDELKQQLRAQINANRTPAQQGTVTFTSECDVTSKPYSVTITREQYFQILTGEYIQVALKDKTPEERDFVLNNTTPDEFNEIFKDMEE